MGLPRGFESHAQLNSTYEEQHCWRRSAEAPVLRNQTLAAREVTDVLLLDFSSCLGERKDDLSLVTTLGYDCIALRPRSYNSMDVSLGC